MLAAIGFLVWILFNLWLTLMCIAMVFVPVNVGARNLSLGEVVVFAFLSSCCAASWYYAFNSVTVSLG
tara:strand:+ start:1236 stop:1439 length:204 start_codon:yes stop_codon:yes gene_type:complete